MKATTFRKLERMLLLLLFFLFYFEARWELKFDICHIFAWGEMKCYKWINKNCFFQNEHLKIRFPLCNFIQALIANAESSATYNEGE